MSGVNKKPQGSEAQEVEEERSEDPPARRERSPSAMSHSSGVLEWDPSADVGAMGMSNLPESKDSVEEKKELSTLQRHISEVKVVYAGPGFDLEGGQHRSRHNSGRSSASQKSKRRTYSTPSGSPVPLETLQYSPVSPEPSKNDKLNNNALPNPDLQNQGLSKDTPAFTFSSDDNNAEAATDGKRSPGVVISEVSTDWEYDKEKHLPSKSLSQWQTSGLTRSEIEYQNRKTSASSTSVASSVFILKVDANVNSEGNETSPENANQNKEREPSPSEFQEHKELERKVQKALSRHSSVYKRLHYEQGSTDSSDPSSMCGIVEDFVKLIENNPTKENIKYDVLKKHRDYHLMKVWKQISKLEKLNINLMSYKPRVPEKVKSKSATNIKATTSSEQDMEDIINFYTKRSRPILVKSEKLTSNENIPNSPRRTSPMEFFIPLVDKISQTVPSNHSKYFSDNKRNIGVSTEKISCSSREEVRLTSSNRNYENIYVPMMIQTEPMQGYVKKSSKQTSPDPPHRTSQREFYIPLVDNIAQTVPSNHSQYFSDGERNIGTWTGEIPRLNRKVKSVNGKYDGVYMPTKIQTRPVQRVARKSEKMNTKIVYPSLLKPKSPIGFYIPLVDEERSSGNVPRTSRKTKSANRKHDGYDEPMTIQDCFIKNNPNCYKSVKERDDFLINMKRDRQVYNETLLREVLQSELNRDEIEQYLEHYLAKADPDERKRLRKYWDLYLEAQNYKQHVRSDHVIPLKEMKERTARLRKTDPVVLERLKKEAEERRKVTSRTLQKDFSSNLRRFQRMGKVNVPDRLKLGTRPIVSIPISDLRF